MKKVISFIVLLSFVLLGLGTAQALDTKYENRQGYDNTQGYKVVSGYNNLIPYHMFFAEYAPKPETIQVQGTTRFGSVIQAEIPIHQKEQKINGNLKRVDGLVK